MGRFTGLIGNGLSIAFDEGLAVQKLTVSLAAEFQSAGAELPALLRLAREADAPGFNFEALLGPLDRLSQVVRHLEGLTAVVQELDEDQRRAVEMTEHICRRIHDVGLGIVLGEIARLSRAADDAANLSMVVDVCEALADLGGGPVTVATLNYDALLHAGFLAAQRDAWGRTKWRMCDLGAGYAPTTCTPVTGHIVDALALRTVDDFLDTRIVLINLHGSLLWLRDLESGDMVKVDRLETLREIDYWSKLRAGEATCRPLVVLTDRKMHSVTEHPFALAYGAFAKRLRCSPRWLIGGYGFGDAPVNEALRKSLAARTEKGEETSILVVGRGDPTELTQRAAVILGCDPDLIRADGSGFPAAIAGEEWRQWASS